MSHRDGTINLCKLYDALKNLEAAFGIFADVLVGIKCKGLDCDTNIEVPESVQEAIDWLNHPKPGGGGEGGGEGGGNGGGGWPTGCPSSPCKLTTDDFGYWSKGFANRAPETAVAVALLLKHFNGSTIEYMSRPTGRRG